MAYEYLSDTFGELRSNRKTPYTPIEKKAIQWMIDFVEMRRSGIDFANEFNGILDEFSALFKEIGHFDEDTPLWLNTIGGLHFPRWYQYQQIYWYLHDHYDELTENQLKNYEQIQEMDIDEDFRKICKTCLMELDKALYQEVKKDFIECKDVVNNLAFNVKNFISKFRAAQSC